MRERECNYDLLRVISMIAVIMIHVSGSWVGIIIEHIVSGGGISELTNTFMSCVYNCIPRFAVPCFIMLSGAFVLDNDRTAYYQEFYKKVFIKIGIPAIVFSILYVLYRIPFCFVGEQSGIRELIEILEDIIKGSPYYHMWYLYMLIGIYLMAPIIVRFKDSILYKNFRKIAFVFLVLASISRWTTREIYLNWDLGQSFEYTGYFMMGYVIRKDMKKSNLKGSLFIMLGLLIEIATAFIMYKFQIINGIYEKELKLRIVSPYCPTIVAAALFIFAGFTMLSIKCNKKVENLAGLSFVIYLVHAGVWDFVKKVMHFIIGKNWIKDINNIYGIPLFVIIVFVISVFLANIYNNLELYFRTNIMKNLVRK